MQQQQFTSSWSILLDCAKFSHDHAKSALQFPFGLPHKFQLLFVISSISFFWIYLNHLQISSKSWSKCIDSSSSSTLFALLNSISLLSLDASKITLKYLQNFTKPLVSLAKATMYYLGILGIITTQKVWNSCELLFKIYCFWVVINNKINML